MYFLNIERERENEYEKRNGVVVFSNTVGIFCWRMDEGLRRAFIR